MRLLNPNQLWQRLFSKDAQKEHLKLLIQYWQNPLIVSLGVIISCIILPTSVKKLTFYNQAVTISTIIIITWLAIQAVRTIRDLIIKDGFRRHLNHLNAQRINTQAGILVRVAIIILVIIGASLTLMTFPQIRKVGISILASAGVAGIILGFAAQKSLGNILAGIQIALTQPIKIGDEVVIENEQGTIEEINLTHVVMCTSDKRRLIVPIDYFIEKPFQNWTRISSDLLGTVYLEVDYTTPIQPLRETLDRILQETDLWDKKTKRLQVTDAKSQTIEIRILASAANPANVFNLRCYIREQLIDFLQKNYPACLPKIRVERVVIGNYEK